MSSDSELDEFVDALDETPEDNAGKKIVSPRVDSPVEQTDDVEEEEKRLFKLQKKAEERRRKEDEELRKRWESVQKKKEEERLQQIEEQQWKEAERSRKRKLEEMRLRMLEESTPSKNRSSSSSEEDYPRSDDEDSTNQETGASHVTLEQKSSSVLVTPEKLSSIASNVITSANDTNNDVVLQSQTSLGERVEVITTGSSVIESRPVELIEEQLRRSEAVSVEITEQSSPVVSPLPNLSVPEICCEQESLVERDNSVIDNSVFIESGLTHEEPDIVKSAKLRQVPVTLQPPVAPPRRRKKRDDVMSDFSVEGQSSGCSLLDSPGLPPAVPTPTSTVESLTRELENSLDIQSAIGGDRHVHAQDAEIGAVNSDHSSPASLPSPTPVIQEVATSDPVTSQKEAPPSKVQEDKEKTAVDSPTDEPDPLGRPRSNSGRLLTDEEILEMVMVVNLDTGEKVPLNLAEEALPKCVNPLSLHIMRRTKEYSSDSSLHKDQQLSEDEIKETDKTLASLETSARRKATKFKKFLGKTVGKTVSRVKSVADQSKKVLHGDDVEEEVSVDGKRFKFKACSHNKGPYDFQQFRTLQDLGGEHTGAVWTMKFSPCGRLLATGGQDNILRVWILKSACSYFEDLRHRYSETDLKMSSSPSPAPSEESLDSHQQSDTSSVTDTGAVGGVREEDLPFERKPFCSYRGHTADLLDVSWSKNYFILSSSMDKTVRLWHISRRECLCTFQHIDFVTAIVFHPRDDRYFLSGSLDGKLRLWNIPDKKVTLWNEVSGPSNLITTANFCQNGKFAVVGTYDGKCIFYSTDQLKYYTQVHVRSTRGKNARGRKITGIEPMIGEDRILVTSNDSRIRLYDLRDLTLTCKYKGCTNNSSQIKSSFSPKSRYIICGSEDHFLYIWKTHHELYKFSSARRDRNDFWEAIKVHNAVVTAAIFAPNPALFAPPKEESATNSKEETTQETSQGEVIVSVDFTGVIKVIQNKLPLTG